MKSAIIILILFALISACGENEDITYNSEPKKVEQIDSRNQTTIIDLIHETENLKIYGDTTIDKEKISYASLKFEPYIGFEDYLVANIDNKKYAQLDLKSNKDAYNFRTRLREGFNADTSNFAGHYSFVYWGCGSPCQNSLVIDRKTGKIYNSPGASLGYEFRANSRLLIVNPPDSTGFYDDCFYCKPIIYIFDERTKKFIEKKPK